MEALVDRVTRELAALKAARQSNEDEFGARQRILRNLLNQQAMRPLSEVGIEVRPDQYFAVWTVRINNDDLFKISVDRETLKLVAVDPVDQENSFDDLDPDRFFDTLCSKIAHEIDKFGN